MSPHTITSLKRWSCINADLPLIQDIKTLHVYDFDNTLFLSPLPNQKVWNGPTIGHLQRIEAFANGGWWHDSNILAATGEGVEKEEPKAWQGWWNEQIVSLVQLSMQQKDAVTLLLTGRKESGFSDLLKRIVQSRGLKFDMICLKPEVGPHNQRFPSTMAFKQALLEDLVFTYKNAEEIRVYEDRPKHVKGFRDFFTTMNKGLLSSHTKSRDPITAEVIQVAECSTCLSPIKEVAEVQRMINSHNVAVRAGNVSTEFGLLQIKRTIFYTGYLIRPQTTAELLTLVNIPKNIPENDIKYLANNIIITPRPCPKSILDKVGGLGNKVNWKVTGTAIFENKIWAARVEPVPETEKYYSENPVPIVVLALRKGAKPIDAGRIQNWQPVHPSKATVFETVVGQKVLLRVEEENPNENEWESLFPTKNFKKKHPEEGNDEETGGIPLQAHYDSLITNEQVRSDGHRRGSGRGGSNYRGGNHSRGRGSHRSDRRGRGHFRNSGRGRGRGGYGGYRSLDDVGERSYIEGGVPSYEGRSQPNYGNISPYNGPNKGLPYNGDR